VEYKQPAIPGFESSPGSSMISFRPPRKPACWQAERLTFLEKRIGALEVEISILKILMEAGPCLKI